MQLDRAPNWDALLFCCRGVAINRPWGFTSFMRLSTPKHLQRYYKVHQCPGETKPNTPKSALESKLTDDLARNKNMVEAETHPVRPTEAGNVVQQRAVTD
jgi:hypothetical protein